MTTQTDGPATGSPARRYGRLTGARGGRAGDARLGGALAALGVVVIVAAALPWASDGTGSVRGTTADGQITILCGVVVGVGGLAMAFGYGRVIAAWLAALFAALITLVGIVDVVHGNRITDHTSGVSLGIGLWLTLVAGALALLVSLTAVGLRSRRAG